MTCLEKIYSNEFFDYIVEKEKIPEGSCAQTLNSRYDSIYYKGGKGKNNIQEGTYTAIPKCYTTLDQSALEESGILKVQSQPNLSLKGRGVLIGFVDTGIDLENPVFRYSDGSSRVLAVWDQTDGSGIQPKGFQYGSEYTREEINQRLDTNGALPKDENGHGTYVAGVAAGSVNEEANFSGAAPESMIAMVKCKQAKDYLRDFYHIPKETPCYQENDIMAGLHYLDQLAEKEKVPLIICIAMGSNMGNHGGRNPLSEMMTEIGASKLRCMVCAAGNEAGRRHHHYGTIREGEVAEVEVRVEDNCMGYTLEVWSSAPQLFAIKILSPSGELVPKERDVTQSKQVFEFIFESTRVEVDYRIVGTKTGDQLIFINFTKPTKGIWKLFVYGINLTNGIFNMWLPMKEFLSSDVIFLAPNPNVTVTNPGNGIAAITVGAYSTQNKSLYIDSGRGYSVQNLVKPDLVAPGVNVYGPNIAGSFQGRTGTSPAAAITAGACALYMEWAYYKKRMEDINTPQIRNVLVRGTMKPGMRSYPNQEWGFGILNIYNAFEVLRRP
ncbi:MAG: S8 family peptidase [Lachnospiraceae bacterium]